jgi:hypothetical protein
MRGNPDRWRAVALLAILAAWAVATTGCGSTKMSGTPRTGTEQLLLTNAWDDALRGVDFTPLTGVPVYLDTQHVNAIDQGWVISSIRQAMLEQGVLLRAKPEQAQWIVEPRVGVYGTDSYSMLVGIPQVTVPPTVTGIPAGTVPEIPLIKKSDQQGIAKLAMFAYERASGRVVWRSGTMLASSNAKDIYIGGAGPFQSGTVRKRRKLTGVNIPLIHDPEPDEPTTPRRRPIASPPPMALPSSAADLESFAP